MRALLRAASFAVLSVVLLGASCDRKQAGQGSTPPGDQPPPAPAANQPAVPGVDVAKLNESERGRFHEAVDKLPSPCGKAHSLRKSLETDPGCKRAVFAGRYVARLVGEDFVYDEIEEAYNARFLATDRKEIDVKGSPYEGLPGARVKLIEFYDYGCPHCKQLAPVLEDVLVEFPSDVVLYFKHFPLGAHPDSMPAAIAASAAQRQGRFKEMHRLLFKHQEEHSRDDLFRYAKEIGLDMAKFEKDFDDPALRERVMADRKLGEELEIEGTPSVYINGRVFSDAYNVEMLSDWINEELSMNGGEPTASKP